MTTLLSIRIFQRRFSDPTRRNWKNIYSCIKTIKVNVPDWALTSFVKDLNVFLLTLEKTYGEGWYKDLSERIEEGS